MANFFWSRFSGTSFLPNLIFMAYAKRTPSYYSDLHFISIIMQLSDQWWHSWSDLPKSEIWNIGGVQHIASLSTFFYQAYSIVDLSTYFKAFSNIFSNILTALCWVYIIIPRNVGPRINRDAFSIRLLSIMWDLVFFLLIAKIIPLRLFTLKNFFSTKIK